MKSAPNFRYLSQANPALAAQRRPKTEASSLQAYLPKSALAKVFSPKASLLSLVGFASLALLLSALAFWPQGLWAQEGGCERHAAQAADAGHGGHDHGAMGHGAAAGGEAIEAAGLYQGQGQITGLNPQGLSLELDHDPIPALNWPRMTMGFKVTEADLLADLAVGDKVQFDFKQSGRDWLIVDLEKK
ncbi:MAG: copper-binding protein [Deltaproteobacteria bacterium]|jgi:Cu/Ag efflux protein CusF|nr:copper-binding protein [Deltaproteobacteria bacterium]